MPEKKEIKPSDALATLAEAVGRLQLTRNDHDILISCVQSLNAAITPVPEAKV